VDTVREGDILVVWKLDRLGRSLSHLIESVNDLEDRVPAATFGFGLVRAVTRAAAIATRRQRDFL
jgi:hypothetical protein